MPKGYRQMTDEQLAVMDGLTDVGELLDDFLSNIPQGVDVDPRWMSIAKTHLQQGLMAARRAIAQPDIF